MSHISSNAGEVILNQAEKARFDTASTDLDRVHNVYRDMLRALIASCAKHKVILSRLEFELAMEGIAEALAGEADQPLERIRELGITGIGHIPEDYKELLEKSHNRLIDSFRIRPGNATEQLRSVLAVLAPDRIEETLSLAADRAEATQILRKA